MPWGYRTRDVARMLGMSVEDVRRLARTGLVAARRGPRNELRFTFGDLVVLRAAARGEGAQVVARDGGGRWIPETGQRLLDFDGPRAPGDVADLPTRRAPAIATLVAAHFARGCHLEEASPPEAMAEYRAVLSLAPGHSGAHLNLGRLLHEAGDPVAAEGHYRAALPDPEQAGLAAFDLGVALEDQGRDAEALAAYQQALATDPGLADAHFNASRVEERRGRRAEALRHLATYRRLTHPATCRSPRPSR